MVAGALGKGGPVGPGSLPRKGNLGDIQFILQEVPTKTWCMQVCVFLLVRTVVPPH
jgi:hypothetical protein